MPIAMCSIVFKRLTGCVVAGDEARLAELGVPDRDETVFDIVAIKAHDLAAAHAGHRYQAQHRCIGQRPELSGQASCRVDQRGDFPVAVDVGTAAAAAIGQKALGRNLVVRIDGTGVAGKMADFRKATRSVGRPGLPGQSCPFEGQFRRNVF